MLKILKKIKVIQVKKKKDNFNYTYELSRLNPYNPLTYLVIVLTFIIGLLSFGFVGFFNEINWKDFSFKYR